MNPSDVTQVGSRWKVVRMIGQGGMSWVFEVLDQRFGVARALKMLKPAAANASGYKRFLLEAQTLAKIEDDCLVRIYDLDKDPETGNDYYVMELLSGSDLKQFLKTQGPLAPEGATAIFSGVLQALGKLHAQPKPIIHRDIKPGNIQITESGRPKLLDLGIAKVTRKNAEETVFGDDSTIADMFIGTVLYASPEQLAMQEAGPQSDVFAMGLCIYEAIEGHHAYSGVEGLPDPTNSHVLYQDVFRFYTRLEAIEGKLKVEFKRTPKPLQGVVRKALELDPRRRFRDANEMRSALLDPSTVGARGTEQEIVPPRPPKAPRPDTGVFDRTPEPEPIEREASVTPKPSGSRTWQMALAALALVACLGVAVWLLWPDAKPTSAELLAKTAAEARIAAAAGVALPAAREALDAAGARAAVAQREWVAREYASAATKFGEAESLASEALRRETEPPTPSPVDDADELESPGAGNAQATQLARTEAEQANAAVNAAEEWASGVANQQAGEWELAAQAFSLAGEKSRAALDAATTAQTAAKAARVRLPADCSSIAGGAQPCRDGAGALARGDEALAKQDAPAATAAFQSAAQLFRLAGGAPLELNVQPLGPIAMKVGEIQRFEAGTSPAGATVKYSVQPPAGAPYAASGSSYAFVPGQVGSYRITITAVDTRKRQAAPVEILVTAASKPSVINREPGLALSHTGTVEVQVGELVELRATPTDPDGGKPGIEFTVKKPREAPAIPTTLLESGRERVLRFTPTVAGPYTFSFRAFDAQGLKSKEAVVTVQVAAPAPAPTESPVAAKVRGFLSEFSRAFEARNLETILALYQKPDARFEKQIEGVIDDGLAISVNTALVDEPTRLAATGRVNARVRLSVKGSGAGGDRLVYNGIYSLQLREFADGYTIERLDKIGD